MVCIYKEVKNIKQFHFSFETKIIIVTKNKTHLTKLNRMLVTLRGGVVIVPVGGNWEAGNILGLNLATCYLCVQFVKIH